MEKQQNLANSACDSMATTVTVKDYSSDYQDPPPAYRNAGAKTSSMVQVTKIIALSAIAIAGMLSSALVFSAWLSSSNGACQFQQPPIEVIPPQAFRGILGDNPRSRVDLDTLESKINFGKADDSSEEEGNNSGEDPVMFKLPLELNLQEHMFERNQRSHMNCIIEKKKAEEIVDEQSKPLPPLLGLNMTTDPRYLHFTGEKMAISCDSGNDHRQMPQMHQVPQHHLPMMEVSHPGLNFPQFSDIPGGNVHIIGPIPIGSQHNTVIGPPPIDINSIHHLHNNGHPPPPPHLIPLLFPQHPPHHIVEESPYFPQQQMPHHQMPQIQLQPQSNEIRERALQHPIPIMPRQHIQHVIRPRSVNSHKKEEEKHSRVKRCACDCACKNH